MHTNQYSLDLCHPVCVMHKQLLRYACFCARGVVLPLCMVRMRVREVWGVLCMCVLRRSVCDACVSDVFVMVYVCVDVLRACVLAMLCERVRMCMRVWRRSLQKLPIAKGRAHQLDHRGS